MHHGGRCDCGKKPAREQSLAVAGKDDAVELLGVWAREGPAPAPFHCNAHVGGCKPFPAHVCGTVNHALVPVVPCACMYMYTRRTCVRAWFAHVSGCDV